MAKKSRKYSTKPENHNGSCTWNLVSLLDFHLPRYSPRLLLDRKHGSNGHSPAQKYSNEKGRSQYNHVEKQKLLDYTGNSRSETGDPGRSVRLLLEEEISKLQPAHKEIRLSSGEGGSPAQNNLQADLASDITSRLENNDLRITTYSEPSRPGFQDVLERFSINLNLVALLQEFYSDKVGGLHVNSVRDNIEQYPFMRMDCSKLDSDHSESTMQTIQSQYVLRKTLNEILEVFLCDKINDLKQSGCTGLLRKSEQSSNALDVISLNKELFLKFLQDPNSHLAKYIQALQISHSQKLLSSDSCKVLEDIKLLGSNCGSQQASSSSSKQFRMQSIQNIFRKKDKNVKSLTEGAQTCSRIVVLKPIPSRTESLPDVIGPSTSHSPHNLRASGPSDATAFHFSFRQIKRKLKHILERKKEQHILSRKKESHFLTIDTIQKTKLHGSYPGGSLKNIPINGLYMNSKVRGSYNNALPQKSYGVKSTGKIPSLEDTLIPNPKLFSNSDRETNFQKEARKHIFEMLDLGYDGIHLPTEKVSRTLEKMLFSQECNFSPKSSPRMHMNSVFSPTETKLSPFHAPTSESNAKRNSTEKYDLGGSPEIDKSLVGITALHGLKGDTTNAEKVLSCSGESTLTGLKDGTKSSTAEVLKNIGSSNLTSVDTNNGTSGIALRVDSDLSSPHLRLGVIEVDKDILTPLAPPGVLLVKHMDAPECFSEKPKYSSPVSVLDTSCLDNCDSCRSPETVKIEPDSAELSVYPRNLQYEEERDEVYLTTDETTMQSCTDEDLRFELVRYLLEASGIAGQKSWWRWHSSQCLLQPSLYHQVETAWGGVLDDLLLLFDCVNEVLEGIRCRYCTHMPWVFSVQPIFRPFPLDEDLVEEVWKGTKIIDNLLLVNATLDQIVRRDLETSTWMDIRPQLSEIGVALEDEIWEDIMEEMMLALWE